jgi:hypothetical protein
MHHASLCVDRRDLCHDNRHVPLSRENLPNGSRNLRRGEPCRSNLVEQRLEEMMVESESPAVATW